jgi:metal-sulfur cluster biosynthetic enzyme
MATSDVGAPRWVLDALSDVYDPCCREKGISVVDMGLLRSATVNGTHARIELMLTSGWCPFATHLLGEIEDALLARPDVDTCDVEVVWDEAWTTDRLSQSAVGKLRFLPDPAAVPDRDAFVATLRRPRRSTDDR